LTSPILPGPPPLRVLHLYAGNLYGGIERVLGVLASQRHLCPEMEPHFALCFDGRLAEELRAANVPPHMLGNVRLSRPWTVWRARRRLKELLKATPGFDVVITQSCWVHAAFAPTVRQAGLPLWFWAHDAYLHLNRVERAAARTKPDYVIANSKFTLGTISRLFGDVPGEVLYCPLPSPPPMDRDAVRLAIRTKLGCSLESKVILMGSRLEPYKGHTLLLEGLALLKPGDWQAWIAGGPQRPHEQDYYTQLQAMAQRLGIGERVRWLGQRTDIPQLLRAADIYCQPNIGPEPFGIVFIEAMQAGVPVVTTKLGAAPEIVDHTCGMLTEPGMPQSLANELNRLSLGSSRSALTGGPARAAALCDPQQQLELLSAAIKRHARPAGNPDGPRCGAR